MRTIGRCEERRPRSRLKPVKDRQPNDSLRRVHQLQSWWQNDVDKDSPTRIGIFANYERRRVEKTPWDSVACQNQAKAAKTITTNQRLPRSGCQNAPTARFRFSAPSPSKSYSGPVIRTERVFKTRRWMSRKMVHGSTLKKFISDQLSMFLLSFWNVFDSRLPPILSRHLSPVDKIRCLSLFSRS